ncbi:MAG: GNAT family N-acetyltransferase, partial [Planctomycetes bacterium]|nr:GNAT family N-acetyltransferase [Planctomycetota bacterium]
MSVSTMSFSRMAEVPAEWDDLVTENPFLLRANLAILEETNPCAQHYHLIGSGQHRLAVVTYRHRLNILTLGRGRLTIPVTVVGIPCSVSRCGYAPLTAQGLLNAWVPSIKGGAVVLNGEASIYVKDALCDWTLPSCRLDIRWPTAEAYLTSMRSPYRRRLNRAVEAWRPVEVNLLDDVSQFDETLYALYGQVYDRSAFKLERLGIEFFCRFQSTIHVCRVQGQAIAFYQTYGCGEELIFMFGGMDYAQRDRYDTYFNILLGIVRYAIEHGYAWIDFGQTAE